MNPWTRENTLFDEKTFDGSYEFTVTQFSERNIQEHKQ